MIQVCGECPFFNNGDPIQPKQYFGRCSSAVSKRIYRGKDEPICSMFKKTTMEQWLWPLMKGTTVKLSCCPICGKPATNMHHIVRRGDGELFGNDGRPRTKPKISLCGSGTTGCHGLAHQLKLHFRWKDGAWEYLKTDEPVGRAEALELSGWKAIRMPERANELVEINSRCGECKWVLLGPTDQLWCGHPSLTVSIDWLTPDDPVEPLLPVDADDFCSRGEWCG